MPQRLDDLPEWFAPVNDLYEAEDGRLTAAEFYALAEMLNWVEVNYRSSPLPRTEELEAWADQHQEAEVWATGMRLCRAAGPRLRHPRGERRWLREEYPACFLRPIFRSAGSNRSIRSASNGRRRGWT